MLLTKLLPLLTLLLINNASALNILGIFPFAGRSHFIGGGHLLKELVRRGHKVDVISHFPEKEPMKNYNDISIRGSMPMFANNISYANFEHYNSIDMKNFIKHLGNDVCELLGLPRLQELMKTPPGTYDVILVEVRIIIIVIINLKSIVFIYSVAKWQK